VNREPGITEREPDAPDNLTEREPKSPMIASPAAHNCKRLQIAGSLILSGRWVLAPPMLSDLVASADPDPVVAQDVIDETGKRGGASRFAGETAMHSDGHHLRRLLALAVERVEIVAQRDEEILGLTPAQATREARVVVVERVRDDEMWPAVIVGPRVVRRCRRRCHKGTRLPQRQGAVDWRSALVEVPVMLSVVRIVLRTRSWYEHAQTV
jgi:hypothetical protein